MIAFVRPYDSKDATAKAHNGIRTILAELADDAGRLPNNPAILQETSCRILKFLGRDCRPFLRHVDWRILSIVTSLARIMIVGDEHEGLRFCLEKVLQTLYVMVQVPIEHTPLSDEYEFLLEESMDVIELASEQVEPSGHT